MLNIPVNDQLGLRFAYTNLQKDGVHQNIYSQATDDFDNRDGYQWRASLLYEFDDTMRITAIHNAYDEESARNQVSGVWCETGGSLVQGCVVGGNQVFQQISPMSNGSTLPSLLGRNLGFYFPGQLGCASGANTGKCYNPLAGFNAPAAGALANGLYAALVDVPNIPNEFFKANVWRSPRHEAQESTSQLLFEKDFDEGQLTVAFNEKKRVFYRDTSSLSYEASTIRWQESLQNNPVLYLSQGATLGSGAFAVTGDSNDGVSLGVPLGYSNFYATPNCDMDAGANGSFCTDGEGVRGYHRLPVSGDASYSSGRSSTYEIKYASDMDGFFNFQIGGISISNETNSFYQVYASGITMNGLQLPATIASSYRDGYAANVGCAYTTPGQPSAGTCTLLQKGTGEAIVAGLAGPAGIPGYGAGETATAQQQAIAQAAVLDRIARIDGVYTENFNNETAPFILDAEAIFTEFYFDVADNHKLTLGLRYTQDRKEVRTRATFYDSPLVSDWTDAAKLAGCAGQNPALFGTDSTAYTLTNGAVTFSDTCHIANSGGRANTVGQVLGKPISNTANAATGGQAYLLSGLDAFNADYANAVPSINPVKEFSNTTGRLVWDWQIDDDTLMYISYSKGFKGGGFNPPFNAAQFPNTPFAFESTEVEAIEIGVKATVPEVGLVANASFYYNDFENFHLGSIRNETAINYGIPLESMGAELELLLNPPDLPGLTFNMQLSYYDSEIGAGAAIVNPHDLGGHYNGLASASNWHVAKSHTANSFLAHKDHFGYIYGNVLEWQLSSTAAYNAAFDGALVAASVSADQNTAAAVAAGATTAAAARKANATTAQTLAAVNAGNDQKITLAATAGMMANNELAISITGGIAAAGAAGQDARDIMLKIDGATQLIVPAEMSAAATAYGEKSNVCHFIPTGLPGGATIDTCLPAGLTPGNVVAADNRATASHVYSPETVQVSGVTIASPNGTMLPSIAVLPNSGQTGGICALYDMFIDAAGNATQSDWKSGAGIVKAQTDPDGDGTNAADTCLNTATTGGGLINTGLEQSIAGNPMPFSDITLSMGIAYTFQTDNLEVTPRLDYYYRSDAPQNVFNIQQNKVPAWDEINFRLNIVPTDGDWRISFYGQNLTDERNVTATAITNSSTSHTNTVFVREPRSFGFQFGIDF